jgi:DNA-binding transcriptional MocR family regulator
VRSIDWTPQIAPGNAPLYERLVEALERDVASGALPPGCKLPTHRDLAHHLGISLGTVTRAYAEAERRRLVGGQQGRGTFVAQVNAAVLSEGPESALVDLSRNVPPPLLSAENVGEALARLQRRPDLLKYLDYVPHAGVEAHRATISQWLARRAVPATTDNLVITSGAQHAVSLVLDAVLKPGDGIGVEAFTYYGLKFLAREVGSRLHAIAMDAEGMLPDALEAACAKGGLSAVYVMPTLQTPTARTMSPQRRRDLAEVCRRHDLMIIEDDVYGFLAPNAPPPIAQIAPERTFYISSISKSIAPGFRIGFLVLPGSQMQRLQRRLGVTCWMASPLTSLIAAEWIQDGTADNLAGRLRAEAKRRLEAACRSLPQVERPSLDTSFHLWIPLPSGEAEAVVRRAAARHVIVTPHDAFAAEGGPDGGIRICLGSPRTFASLDRGLAGLADALRNEDTFLSIV